MILRLTNLSSSGFDNMPEDGNSDLKHACSLTKRSLEYFHCPDYLILSSKAIS